jgi:hypothetical protein
VKKSLAALIMLSLGLALSACSMPIGSPSSNPDHGPPKPPNGNILNPVRPKGIPDNAMFMSWHILALDEDWEEGPHIPVRFTINAVGNAPAGNVHGNYPFSDYVYTPYTHTIWYPPGVEFTTDVVAVADPPLGTDGTPVSIVCVASSTNHIVEPIFDDEVFMINDYCRASWNSAGMED